MTVLNNAGIRAGASGAGGGDAYQIEKSLRFNDDDSAYLSKTLSSSGNTKTYAISLWVKRGNLGKSYQSFLSNPNSSGINGVYFGFASDYLNIQEYNSSGSLAWAWQSAAQFRDTSAWYHIVAAVDTTQATEADRLKVYVNGVQVTDFYSGYPSYPTPNFVTNFNNDTLHAISKLGSVASTSYFFDGYLAEVNFIDGQAKTDSDFGETNATTGQWVPKEYSGSYGTNGFYLKFNGGGQIYSDGITGSEYGASYSKDQMFDGNTATSYLAGDSSSVTWTPAGGLAFDSTFKIESEAGGDMVFNWDGGSYTLSINGQGKALRDLSSNLTSPITSVTWTTAASAAGPYIYRIEIDGNVLIDHTDIEHDSSGNGNHFDANTLTASQLTTVGAATGGLPIHNTSGDYGGTKESGYRTDSSAGTTGGTGLVLAIPGDTTTDVHASINTGSSTKTLSTSGTVSTSTAKSKFYGTSIDMTSTTAADHWTAAASSDFNFGTGNYTIEWWHYWDDATGYQSIFDCGYTDAGGILLQSYGGIAAFWVYINGSVVIQEQLAGNANLQEWTHYALVRNGTTLTLYRNGVDIGNATSSVSTGLSDHDFHIGADEFNYYIRGYIQDFRVYKGVAKYTSAFSVVNPTESLEADVSTDSPTPFDDGGNGTGNYCTWNPLFAQTVYSNTLSQGSLKVTGTGDARGTMSFGSGKWYWEVRHDGGTLGQGYLGIIDINSHGDRVWHTSEIAATRDSGWGLYGNGQSGSSPASWSAGDIINFAVDVVNQKLFIGVNGTWTNNADPAAGTGASITGRDFSNYTPLFSDNNSDATYTANFGQRAWAYPDSVPDGFKALNTFNLDDPTIVDPSKHFDVGLDTGPNILTTALGLTDGADFVWIKDRANLTDHILFNRINDSDMDGDPHLISNDTDDEDDCGAYSAPTGNSVAWVWNAGTTNTSVSAGDLNDSAYNLDQVWTTGWSQASAGTYLSGSGLTGMTPDVLFDWPVDAHSFIPADSSGAYASGSEVTFTPNGTTGIPCSSLILKVTRGGSGPHLYVNNVDCSSSVSGTWSEQTIAMPAGHTHLKTLKFVTNSGSDYIQTGYIKVNGKYIIDDGESVTSIPTIASTYRANPTAGFSIVSYTGTGSAGTLAHGLNATPELILVKRRNDTQNWVVGHQALAAAEGLYLDTDANLTTASDFFDSHSNDSSSVFSIGNNVRTGQLNDTYVAHVWAPVEGYSKFGSYEGAWTSTAGGGVFVYCGFKPAWILVKNTEANAEDWYMWDSKRDGYNPTWQFLEAHDTDDENSSTNHGTIDIVSNGFKLRVQYAPNNTDTYIFAAFAESPFKHSNAR